MSFKLWVAKYWHKRIQRSKRNINTLTYWLGHDRKKRNKALKELDLGDFMRFGLDTGYVPKRK